MKNYQHSVIFDKFKTTKEEISANLTTLQYLQTLDHFLWLAIQPIARECPTLYSNYLAKIVARQSLKASSKLSSDDRSKLPIKLFNLLTTKDETKAFEQSKLMYINRGIMFGLLSLFRERLKRYKELQSGKDATINPAVRRTILFKIEQNTGLRSGGNLTAALKEVVYWDNKARYWKSLIVEKYTRMAIMNAKTTYKDYNCVVDLNDIIQIYMLVVNRAIDRCDARQGVLTTFIQNWFKSARSEIACMAQSQSYESYESLVEDYGDLAHEAVGVTMPDLTDELTQHVAYLAKSIDYLGLVRTALHIPEYVPRSMKTILERHKI